MREKASRTTNSLINVSAGLGGQLLSTLLKFVLLILCFASNSMTSGLFTPYSFAISKIRFFPIQLPPASISRSIFS